MSPASWARTRPRSVSSGGAEVRHSSTSVLPRGIRQGYFGAREPRHPFGLTQLEALLARGVLGSFEPDFALRFLVERRIGEGALLFGAGIVGRSCRIETRP